jgi:hypothetical protein
MSHTGLVSKRSWSIRDTFEDGNLWGASFKELAGKGFSEEKLLKLTRTMMCVANVERF